MSVYLVINHGKNISETINNCDRRKHKKLDRLKSRKFICLDGICVGQSEVIVEEMINLFSPPEVSKYLLLHFGLPQHPLT